MSFKCFVWVGFNQLFKLVGLIVDWLNSIDLLEGFAAGLTKLIADSIAFNFSFYVL